MSAANLPGIRQSIVDVGGLCSRPYYLYFQYLGNTATNLQAQIAAIVDGGSGIPSDVQVKGPDSVQVLGTLGGGNLSLKLVNDVVSAPPVSFYGTGSSGTKGWNLIASCFADSANIVKSVTTGITSFNLTDVTLTTGGILAKYAFDAKGRLSATDSATTSNLPEGSNLYYTDARADARITLQKGQPLGLATLDSAGQVPVAQLPPIAITDTFVVNSQAAMLALTAQTGDLCVRTDLNETFILAALPASTLANWVELLFPGGGVTSFNGRTGAVTPQPGDYAASDITGAVSTSRTISTTAPLTGGGDLSADRTLAIPAATSSDDGYLSGIDWTAFNGKLDDAPSNGNTYARKNSLWLSIASVLANSDGFQIGNILVQIGSDSAPIPSSANVTSKAITFPVAYTTLLYAHAIPTVSAVTSSGFNAVSATLSKSGTGFTAGFDSDSGGVSGAYINKIITFDWIAIGVLPSIGTLTITGAFSTASVGVPYSSSLPITGGTEPYNLTGGTGIISGSLDAGFSLSITGSTGAYYLTLTCASPATADTMTFTASIYSADAQTATSPQSVMVNIVNFATLNPADKSPDITLSSGNLVATGTSLSSGIVRATVPILSSGGPRYFEASLVLTGGAYSDTIAAGFATASASLTGSLGYATPDGWAMWGIGGSGARNGSLTYALAIGSGSIGIAINGANAWLSVGGVWLGNVGGNDPATGCPPLWTNVPSSVYPAACPWSNNFGTSNVITMHFDPSSFVYTAPSGFLPVY